VTAGRSREERIVAAGADEVGRILAGSIAVAELSTNGALYTEAKKTRSKSRGPRYTLVDRESEAGHQSKGRLLRFLFGKRQGANRALTVGEPAPRSARSIAP
jgi:hypothetical protein